MESRSGLLPLAPRIRTRAFLFDAFTVDAVILKAELLPQATFHHLACFPRGGAEMLRVQAIDSARLTCGANRALSHAARHPIATHFLVACTLCLVEVTGREAVLTPVAAGARGGRNGHRDQGSVRHEG